MIFQVGVTSRVGHCVHTAPRTANLMNIPHSSPPHLPKNTQGYHDLLTIDVWSRPAATAAELPKPAIHPPGGAPCEEPEGDPMIYDRQKGAAYMYYQKGMTSKEIMAVVSSINKL